VLQISHFADCGGFIRLSNGCNPMFQSEPFDLAWSFACYLFPLMLAELYFWARERANERGQWAVVICLGLATLLMGLGIAAAFQMLWRPYL
jgi:predicted Na+-dependent transporter